jgi:hypothetical protein
MFAGPPPDVSIAVTCVALQRLTRRNVDAQGPSQRRFTKSLGNRQVAS